MFFRILYINFIKEENIFFPDGKIKALIKRFFPKPLTFSFKLTPKIWKDITKDLNITKDL